MKKVLSLLLILILASGMFSSCSNSDTEQYPLTVNGTPIDGEIFRYFLDAVWDAPEATGTRDGRITEATYKCIRYVAVNSTFHAYSLSLTDAEIADISTGTNVLWNMFGNYYEGIGVSKQTYLKIRTSEYYTEKLRLAFFDKGGTDEISDALLRGVLMENYAAFRYVRTPATNTDVYGHEIPYTEEEFNRLNALYNSAISSASASYGVENAYSQISKEFPLSEQSYETVVIDRNDHEFSSAFYDTVKSISEGSAKVFQYKEHIYLIYRMNILTDPVIFSDKRPECLKIISEEPLQSKINIMCNAYQSVRDTALVGQYYQEVANNR
ncbi:MAG: hypothetical protein IKL10_03785 [Clostridia bacterium]|nr:hypothetical protein [Clostridia bacterium]